MLLVPLTCRVTWQRALVYMSRAGRPSRRGAGVQKCFSLAFLWCLHGRARRSKSKAKTTDVELQVTSLERSAEAVPQGEPEQGHTRQDARALQTAVAERSRGSKRKIYDLSLNVVYNICAK